MLIIRKINKKKSTLNYEYELERSATRESKAPIHNTQAYFFQRHKMKTEEAILEDPGESMTLSLGNTKSIKKQDTSHLTASPFVNRKSATPATSKLPTFATGSHQNYSTK